MRLLFLTQTYPRFADDTAGPFIRDLARGLVAGGDEVTVLTPHAPDVRASWDDDGVEVVSFRYAPEPWELIGYSRSLSSDEKMRLGAAAAAPLYVRGARAAVRRQLEQRSYDLLQGHWVVPNGLVITPFAGQIPLAVGLHGSDVFIAEKAGIRSWVGRALGKMKLVTGCSPELVDRVCALGFDSERSRVIPYGVNTEQFRPAEAVAETATETGGPGAPGSWRRRLGIPPEAPLMIGVGRMVTKKGFHVLFDALPELMDDPAGAHLVLAGSGDRLEEFRSRAAPWADRVHLPGIVMRDTLPGLYREADLFVLPAVHDPKGNVDGLPNVILEAMASGLPVVVSGISGIPMAVDDGVEGRLVSEGDRQGLAAAILDLLQNPDRRRQMGAAARRRAETSLTWKAIAARYRQAYVDALA